MNTKMRSMAKGLFQATPPTRIPEVITTPQGFVDLFRTLADWLFAFVLVIAVIFIVLSALQLITGGGDPTQVSQARTRIIWIIIGIVVALLAGGVPEAIQNLFGTQ